MNIIACYEGSGNFSEEKWEMIKNSVKELFEANGDITIQFPDGQLKLGAIHIEVGKDRSLEHLLNMPQQKRDEIMNAKIIEKKLIFP
jgi:hypothetical protein